MASAFKSQAKPGEDINISKVLDLFRRRWYLLLISIVVSVIAAKIYLRYTRPIYQASASLKILDNASQLRKLGIFTEMESYTDNIQSEIQFIKSRNIIKEALSRMNYDVQYFNVGTLLVSELYNKSPFEIVYDKSQTNIPYYQGFDLDFLDEKKYKLSYKEGENMIASEHYVGEPVLFKGFKFHVILRPDQFPLDVNDLFRFQLVKVDDLIGRASASMSVEPMGYMVDLVQITSKDEVAGFTSDFINSLCQVYVEENKNIQTVAADQTLAFIEGQLDSIKNSVGASEDTLLMFKRQSELVSVESKVEMGLEEVNNFQKERWNMQMAQVEIQKLEEEVTSHKDRITLPLYLGEQGDMNLSALITGYNLLIQDRIVARSAYTDNHPKIKEMDMKLEDLRNSIMDNVNQMKRMNQSKLNYLDAQISRSRQSLLTLPQTQRQYVGLMREYEVKEKIFSTLLEKRAEAAIARASIVSKVRIVDEALLPENPISPIPTKVYSLAGGMGITIGIMLILLLGFLKNTLSYREEVENVSLTPIIGVVRRSANSVNSKYPRLLIVDNPKSSLSESIRAIRTNLQFISADKKCKTVSITSTVSGEGKSFITINLAGMISMLGKKVVILDMDLRKPKLHFSFGYDNTVGISTFLVGKNELNEVLMSTPLENLDVITSGPIPPNPAELIQSFRMEMLLMELRKRYDYILIDTPPIGLVTDGTTLLKMSDASLYVFRADYSKKTYAYIPDQLVEEHKIKNMYLVLNSVNQAGGKYGGYGYNVYHSGYYSETEDRAPWWQVWKRINIGKKEE